MLEPRGSRRPGPFASGGRDLRPSPVVDLAVGRGLPVPLLLRPRRRVPMVHVPLLAGAAVAIYLACEWFINAVEWLGLRLNVGKIAVGTLLAAIGTALPESVVTFVAVVFGHGVDSKNIGVGAAMGGPLVLS